MGHSYQYQGLHNDRKEIRLMRMLPADNPEDDVALTLRTIPLDEAENVPFKALSYVWGSPDHSSKVLVHGSGTSIPTTPNLIQALKSLRSDAVVESPWMWIDAICVNQQDLDERSQQVQYMATIYSKAAKVVAWVGPPTCDSDIALDYFEDISRHVSFDYENFEFHAKTSDLSWTKPQYIEDVQSAAIISFFQRSWFSRLWIRQEILLGSDRAVIRCGSRTISWMHIRVAISYIHAIDRPDPSLQEFLEGIPAHDLFVLALQLFYPGLPSLLANGRATKCSDDRDRVYGFLSLVPRGPKIVPDYSKSTKDVYIHTAIAEMIAAESFNILQHVGPQSASMLAIGLPTWAPDWTMPDRFNVLGTIFGRAGFCVDNLCFTHNDGILRVKGKIVGTIKQTCPWPIDWFNQGQLGHINKVEMTAYQSVVHGIAEGDDDLLGRFCRVATFNQFSDRLGGDIGLLSRNEVEQAVRDALVPGFVPQENHERAWTLLNSYTRGRSLFVSQDGQLGTTRLHARTDDVIAVIPGCEAPIVLRPAADGNKFTVIGAAYFDGVMDGEALLGPLPDTHETFVAMEEERAGTPSMLLVCRDLRTGEDCTKDPRIPDHLISQMDQGVARYDLMALQREGIVPELDTLELI